MYRFFLILALFSTCLCEMEGQYLLAFHTENDDSHRSWVVEVEIDSLTTEEGTLEITWGLDNDFTEWSYSVADKQGDIIQRYDHDPGYWELRSDTTTVSIRQIWRTDPTKWTISMGEVTFKISSTRGNIIDEWAADSHGDFLVYTERRGDARDWIIEDYMNDDIPFEMRMAVAFIAIYTSSPKI